MGCGGSSHSKTQGYETQAGASGASKKPGKPPVTDNISRITVEDEESDYDSDEFDMPLNKRSKSVIRMEALAKERDEEAPEMFFWGDFVVDVNQVHKKPDKKRNIRQPIIWTKKSGTAELEGTFQFGDFSVSKMDGEEDLMMQAMLQPSTEVVPKKNLEEYHVRAYEIYSLIGMRRHSQTWAHNSYTHTPTGHSARVKCICVSPSEQFFISCSNEDTSMQLCDIHTGKEIMSFMGYALGTHVPAHATSPSTTITATAGTTTQLSAPVSPATRSTSPPRPATTPCACGM